MCMETTQRYFLELAYQGTHYHGWQVQPNAITVQQVLNQALSTILQETINVVGCGRTDTGVHASHFVAHFDSRNCELEAWKNFVFKLNCLLPQDVAVHKLYAVSADANSRFDATSRTYQYFINTVKDPFRQAFAARMYFDFDVEAMNQASQLLLQHIDFTSFSKLHTDAFTNNCKVTQAFWEKKGSELVFTITADRFLRNMVRAIVGTLLEVGKGKLSTGAFNEIILAKDRGRAGISVPAQGLFLVKVGY